MSRFHNEGAAGADLKKTLNRNVLTVAASQVLVVQVLKQ